MHTRYTLLALVTLAIPAITFAATDPSPTDMKSRVRPYDDRTATLFVEGQRRSATLRALVDAIEARDVIVYLQMEPALLKGSVDGMVTWLTATKHARYVRISLNPQLSTILAIGVLGHELQHVLEIANEPSVTSSRSLEKFYQRVGINTRAQHSHWDTEAARVAGDEVRREVSAAVRSAESPVRSAVQSAQY
jgi:hypothetical protein